MVNVDRLTLQSTIERIVDRIVQAEDIKMTIQEETFDTQKTYTYISVSIKSNTSIQ